MKAVDLSSYRTSPFGATDMYRGAIIVAIAFALGVFIMVAAVENPKAEVAVTASVGKPPAALAQVDQKGPDKTTVTSMAEEPLPAPAPNPKSATPASMTTSTVAGPRPPKDVKVTVYNGSGVKGAAARRSEVLEKDDYATNTPGNSATVVEKSTILYVPGYEAEAKAVAKALGAPSSIVAVLTSSKLKLDDVSDVQVAVVVGMDGVIATD